MDALLSLDRELVVSVLHILWPISGDLWFDAVVEVMTAAGIDYPGNNFVLNNESGLLEFSSDVDLELAQRLLEIVNGVVVRDRDLSGASLLVVRCTCFKLVIDY
jgi:hypothetical protein